MKILIPLLIMFICGCNRTNYENKEWVVKYSLGKDCDVDLYSTKVICYERVGLERIIMEKELR